MSLLLPRLRRLTILDDRGNITRFKPNQGQLKLIQNTEDQFARRQRVRTIVLKARQIGFSTAIEGIGYELCKIFPNYNGLVMAHNKDTGAELLAMTKRYHDHDPFKRAYTLKTDAKADLAFVETGSRIKVETAGNSEAGRGTTKRFIHQSEAAFYRDPDATMNALRNAIHPVPTTAMFIESTANGIGNAFHTEWENAVARETDVEPLFFPWHEHAHYCAEAIGISPVIASMDEEERILKRTFGLTDGQLAWRRWKIRDLGGDLLKFHQEFPSDPEEAFLSTGTNVFPADVLKRCYEPLAGHRGLLVEGNRGMKFTPSADGHLIVFKAPSADSDYGEYMIGADPTNTTRGDFAVAQVINRRTLEQVAILRLRCDAFDFGKYLYQLGEFYNWASISPEVEGPGGLTIGALQGMGYPAIYIRQSKLDKTPGKLTGTQLGWSTSLQTKHIAVGFGIRAMTANDSNARLLIHDAVTYKEMKNYVTLDNGGYGNGDGSPNDDTVMAMLIALASHFTDAPPDPYGNKRYGSATSMQLADPVTADQFGERFGLDAMQAAGVPGVTGGRRYEDDLYGEIEQSDYDDEGY